MGKPKKGRKVEVVSQNIDLDTFNAIEAQKANQAKLQQQTGASASILSKAQLDYNKGLELV